jgi:hypothetical protein
LGNSASAASFKAVAGAARAIFGFLLWLSRATFEPLTRISGVLFSRRIRVFRAFRKPRALFRKARPLSTLALTSADFNHVGGATKFAAA